MQIAQLICVRTIFTENISKFFMTSVTSFETILRHTAALNGESNVID